MAYHARLYFQTTSLWNLKSHTVLILITSETIILALGPTLPLFSEYCGLFSHRKWRDSEATTTLNLVLRLQVHGAIPPFLHLTS
jgi:hypothetical protein